MLVVMMLARHISSTCTIVLNRRKSRRKKWNENVRTPFLAALCKPKGLKIGCIDGMVSYYVWVTNDLSMAYVEFFSGRVHELSDAQSKSPFHCTPLYKKCSEIHTTHKAKAPFTILHFIKSALKYNGHWKTTLYINANRWTALVTQSKLTTTPIAAWT